MFGCEKLLFLLMVHQLNISVFIFAYYFLNYKVLLKSSQYAMLFQLSKKLFVFLFGLDKIVDFIVVFRDFNSVVDMILVIYLFNFDYASVFYQIFESLVLLVRLVILVNLKLSNDAKDLLKLFGLFAVDF